MTDLITICPYCQQEKGNKINCCGRADFVAVPAEEDEEPIVYH